MITLLFSQAAIEANSALHIATQIGTPISLIAFVAALSFLIYSRRLKHKEKMLGALPPGDRVQQVDEYLAKHRISGDNLTRDHKFDLFKRDIETRSKNNRYYAGLGAAVFVICFAISAWGYGKSFENGPHVTPPPEQFQASWIESYANPALPNIYFGDIQDIERQPRAWMKSLQDGALVELNLSQTDTKLMWGVTSPPFPNSHGDFQVYINVGTDGNAVVYAYRLTLENGQYVARVLTKRGKQGPKPEYPFEVGSSSKDDVLVAFVAMSKDTYNAVTRDPKFLIRSQPLNP